MPDYAPCDCSKCSHAPWGYIMQLPDCWLKHAQADRLRDRLTAARPIPPPPDDTFIDTQAVDLLTPSFDAIEPQLLTPCEPPEPIQPEALDQQLPMPDDPIDDTCHYNHDFEDLFEEYHSDVEYDDPFTSDSDPEVNNLLPHLWQAFVLSDDDNDDLRDGPDGSDDGSIDLVNDPLFAGTTDVFEDAENDADRGPADTDFISHIPPAFNNHPAICNTYIRAFVSAAFHGSTHTAIKVILNGTHLALQSLRQQFPDLDFPGLDNMARTLPTVEKRLGVSTEGFIDYYFTCNVCWKSYPRAVLYTLASPACTEPDCTGTLYRIKWMSDDAHKRVPTNIMPIVLPETALARTFSQPGKYEQMQHWRGPEDQPRCAAPVKIEGYEVFADCNKLMHDVTDGTDWRSIPAGMERRQTGPWTVEDVDVTNINQQFVALKCPVNFQMNLDWYHCTRNGSRSTGALYLTNTCLPRGIRYLREETILVALFGGLHEPSLEQMNGVLEPFVRNMLKLANGREFHVHGHLQPELTHSNVQMNVSNLPASRKTGGLMTYTSLLFMCPTCVMPFYRLVNPDCFDPTKFVYCDDWRYLKYAFRARGASSEQANKIAERRGVRWSVVDLLPNLFPAKFALVEPMHAFFLVSVKHISKSIIYNSGMLSISGSGLTLRDPMKKLVEFFANLVWPCSVTRKPPSVGTPGGSVKADQWRAQIHILFIGLYVAWEVDGVIPDTDAPLPAENTKIATAHKAATQLVHKRLLQNLLSKNPDPSEDDLEHVHTASPSRSL